MQIAIAAATKLELKKDVLRKVLKHNIDIFYTGVGILSSAVSLLQYALQHQPQLIIQAALGVALIETSNWVM